MAQGISPHWKSMVTHSREPLDRAFLHTGGGFILWSHGTGHSFILGDTHPRKPWGRVFLHTWRARVKVTLKTVNTKLFSLMV